MRFCAFTGFITFRLRWKQRRTARSSMPRSLRNAIFFSSIIFYGNVRHREAWNRIYRESTQTTQRHNVFQSTRRITATSCITEISIENFYSILLFVLFDLSKNYLFFSHCSSDVKSYIVIVVIEDL